MVRPRPQGYQLTLRTAYARDLNQVAQVLTDSFHPPVGCFAWLRPLLKLGIYEDLRSRLNAGEPNYCCLAAIATFSKSDHSSSKSQEEIVGTVELTMRFLKGNKAEEYPYISNLAVSPAYRQQGIARQLLLSCEPRARQWGFRDLYLHVLDSNESAKHLYLSLGYRVERIETNRPLWFWQRSRQLFLHKRLS